MTQALKIARFDLGTSLRTTKALVATVVYAGLALLVAAVSTFLQNKVMAEPGVQDAMKGQMDQVQQAVTAALGNDALLANHLINIPVVLMAFFWLTQSFLPLLVAIISSDILNREIKTRAARFVLLRASRTSLVIGKLMAHGLLFLVAALLSWAVFLVYVTLNLKGFNLGASMPIALKFIGCTVLAGYCYLGLTSLISSLIDGTGVTILVTMVVLIFLAGLAQSDIFGWASPSYYRYKLWSPRSEELLAGIAAYLGFGTLFFAAAWQRFVRRDV